MTISLHSRVPPMVTPTPCTPSVSLPSASHAMHPLRRLPVSQLLLPPGKQRRNWRKVGWLKGEADAGSMFTSDEGSPAVWSLKTSWRHMHFQRGDRGAGSEVNPLPPTLSWMRWEVACELAPHGSESRRINNPLSCHGRYLLLRPAKCHPVIYYSAQFQRDSHV